MARVDSVCCRPLVTNMTGAGSQYLVQTPTGVLYCVFLEQADSDLYFTKSSDGGVTWSTPTSIATGTMASLSIWYDRWSGISAGLIHCAYIESGVDDVLYRTIDTENSDTLSTATQVFAGASTAAGPALSITRARGGNVYCAYNLDGGTEHGFSRLTNANVPNGAWAARTQTPTEAATTDHMILLPGFAADNQDVLCLFWDVSATEISRKICDDSADTVSETSIAGTMTPLAAGSGYPSFSATVDLTNSRVILVAWSATDAANADLRLWRITESAITESTNNVVLNSTDDQGLCAVAIDEDNASNLIVFYGGKSDGSETFAASISVNYKRSTDAGDTWGSETSLGSKFGANTLEHLYCTPRYDTRYAVFMSNSSAYGAVNCEQIVSGGVSRARSNAGVSLC